MKKSRHSVDVEQVMSHLMFHRTCFEKKMVPEKWEEINLQNVSKHIKEYYVKILKTILKYKFNILLIKLEEQEKSISRKKLAVQF